MKALRIFRDTSIYAIGGIADRAVQFLFIPFYMMKLEPAEFGSLALLLLLGELVTKVIHAPANAGLVRYFHSPKYENRQAQLVFTLLIFSGAVGLAAALLFLAAARPIVSFLANGNFSMPGETLFLMVLVFTPVVFLKPIAQLNLAYLRMRQRASLYLLLSLTRVTLTTFITLYGLFILQWGALAPVAANVGGTLLIAISMLPAHLREKGKSFSGQALGDALRYGFPFLPSAYSVLAIDSGDRFLLKILRSVEVVGVYSIAYGLAGVLNIVLIQPLKQAIQPMVHQLEAEPTELRKFVDSASLMYCLFGATAALAMALFSPDVLWLLSDKPSYRAAWPVIPVLCLSYFIRGLGQFTGYGMVMTNKSGLISSGLMLSAAINIVLNVLAIPHLGMQGAAWATVASYAAWGLWKAHYSLKYYGLRFQWGRILSVVALAALCYATSLFLSMDHALLLRLPAKLLLLAIFLAVIWQIPILPREVTAAAHDLLRTLVKKRTSDISDERKQTNGC